MHVIIHYMKNNINFIYLNVNGYLFFSFLKKCKELKQMIISLKGFRISISLRLSLKINHIQIKTRLAGDCFLLRRDLQQKMFKIFIFEWFDKLELYSAYFYFQRCFSYALGIFETIIMFQIFLAHKNKRSNCISKFLYFYKNQL